MRTATILALATAVAAAKSTETSGTLVAAQLRCQGYLCPAWALDLTRWDYVRHVKEQYTWQLSEMLPLAPTVQRSFNIFTAYNDADRTYTVAAASYPGQGLDTFFVASIAGDVTSSTPLASNVLIAHPDTAVSDAGTMVLTRVLTRKDGTLFAVFNDGTITEVDIKGASHSVVANIFDGASSHAGMRLTYAHTLDGSGEVVYSFVQDEQSNNYVITTDLSASPIKVGAPVLIQPIKGQLGLETPLNALFTEEVAGGNSTLTVFFAGNFDSINYLDATSGVQTPVMPSLTDGVSPAQLMCNTDTKDCDYWVTSTYDWVDQTIYFQGHTATSGDDVTQSTMIYSLKWMKGTFSDDLYPIQDAVVNAPVFGFSGYQYIPFAN